MAAAAAEAATPSPALADAEGALARGSDPPLPSEFLRWVSACNAPAGAFDDFVPWRVCGADVGLVRPGFAEELKAFPEVFRFVSVEGSDGGGGRAAAPSSSSSAPLRRSTNSSSSGSGSSISTFITFSDEHDATAEARTEALAGVMRSLRERKVIKGWRDELFPVSRAFGEEPLCLIERAAAVHMGVRAYGVHLNGFVCVGGEREEEGKGGKGRREGAKSESISAASTPSSRAPTHLWVATRSASKPTWPGRLDHLVAGGQPASLSLRENVLKECAEEAGIPEALAATAKPAGVVSYSSLSEEGGAKRDVLFVFDLELPRDFVPEPCDGEVERFDLLPLRAAAALVARSGRFKDNCNLVLADFFVRHGVLQPDDAGYLELVAGLRPGLGEFAR